MCSLYVRIGFQSDRLQLTVEPNWAFGEEVCEEFDMIELFCGFESDIVAGDFLFANFLSELIIDVHCDILDPRTELIYCHARTVDRQYSSTLELFDLL